MTTGSCLGNNALIYNSEVTTGQINGITDTQAVCSPASQVSPVLGVPMWI